MLKGSDIPRPLKVFIWAAPTLTGILWSYILSCKQSIQFFLVGLAICLITSITLSLIAWLLKSPTKTPLFGMLEDDAYWEQVFSDRRREKKITALKVFSIVILWGLIVIPLGIKVFSIHHAC